MESKALEIYKHRGYFLPFYALQESLKELHVQF